MSNLRGFVVSWDYLSNQSLTGPSLYKLFSHTGVDFDIYTRRQTSASGRFKPTNGLEKLESDHLQVTVSPASKKTDWINATLAYFNKHASKYDFVISGGFASADYQIAHAIKAEHPDVKWIAFFNDQAKFIQYGDALKIEDNPFSMAKYMEREAPAFPKSLRIRISPLRIANSFVWEKRRGLRLADIASTRADKSLAIQSADLLVFRNTEQRDHDLADQPVAILSKAKIIPAVFDTTLYGDSPKNPQKSGPLRMVHIGPNSEIRPAATFFRALGELKQHDAHLAKKLQVEFYGLMAETDMAEIIKWDLTDVVSTHLQATYFDGLQQLGAADWQLLIDDNLNKNLSDNFYPSETLIDYFGTEKPIFAVSHFTGATANLLAETGGGRLVSHSASDIALYLAKIIYQHDVPSDYRQKVVAKFNTKNVAPEFKQLLRELTAK